MLSIPGAMYGLGAIGGSLSVIGWGALNTCEFLGSVSCVESEGLIRLDTAILQGNFRNRHAHCHSIAGKFSKTSKYGPYSSFP